MVSKHHSRMKAILELKQAIEELNEAIRSIKKKPPGNSGKRNHFGCEAGSQSHAQHQPGREQKRNNCCQRQPYSKTDSARAVQALPLFFYYDDSCLECQSQSVRPASDTLAGALLPLYKIIAPAKPDNPAITNT